MLDRTIPDDNTKECIMNMPHIILTDQWAINNGTISRDNGTNKTKYSQMKIPEGIEDKHYGNFSIMFEFSALGLHQKNKNLILQLSGFHIEFHRPMKFSMDAT